MSRPELTRLRQIDRLYIFRKNRCRKTAFLPLYPTAGLAAIVGKKGRYQSKHDKYQRKTVYSATCRNNFNTNYCA
ncbi:MAG TPA: hypothetical protein DHT39_14990 [Pantoea sp.]|nr:hypothetical protein D7S44_17895 [Pantoea piersonii]HCX00046.1 hypothetical protein [Pantoea sp.]